MAQKHGLHQRTPLWYYILKEAPVRGNGERPGPVGTTIVSELFVALVEGDLLRLVGGLSPIDGIIATATVGASHASR